MGTVAQRVGRGAMLIAAAVLLAIKAVLGIWAAFALLTATRSDHKTFLGESIESRRTGLGLLVVALVIVTALVAFQLVRLRPWARLGAFVLEGAAIALAITRIGSAPGPAIISLLFSIAVIGLVLAAGGAPEED